MRRTKGALFASLLLMASAAFAGGGQIYTGQFESFTTTMTGAPGTFFVDVSLETTGNVSTSDSQYVWLTFYFVNQDNGSWGGDGTWLYRSGPTSYADSYTFTGLVPGHRYKWSVQAEGLGWTGCCPSAVWSTVWSSNQVAKSNWYNGIWSSFFGSAIDSASTLFNYSAATTGGGAYWNAFAENLMSGVASVHQPNLLEVPTLGQWGLLALGLSLLGFGVARLRR